MTPGKKQWKKVIRQQDMRIILQLTSKEFTEKVKDATAQKNLEVLEKITVFPVYIKYL